MRSPHISLARYYTGNIRPSIMLMVPLWARLLVSHLHLIPILRHFNAVAAVVAVHKTSYHQAKQNKCILDIRWIHACFFLFMYNTESTWQFSARHQASHDELGALHTAACRDDRLEECHLRLTDSWRQATGGTLLMCISTCFLSCPDSCALGMMELMRWMSCISEAIGPPSFASFAVAPVNRVDW